MLECLHNYRDARKIKRELVSSLLTDPAWKCVYGKLERKNVSVSVETGLVWVDGVCLDLPFSWNCCIKRAARRAVLKRLAAALTLLLVLLTGCDRPDPPPLAGTYYPLLAAAMGMAESEGANPAPPTPTPPTPGPTPSPVDTTCPNCNGTGTLGDGTVKIVCPVCDGTGKVTTRQMIRAWILERTRANEVDEVYKKLKDERDGQFVALTEKVKELEAKIAEKPEANPETFEIVPLPGAEIAWQTTLKAGHDQAKAENRPMLTHWYATWCGPCKQMDSRVFANHAVRDALPSLAVLVKLDVDRETAQTKRSWEIRSVPADIVISPDYKKSIRLGPTSNPETYLTNFRAACAQIQQYIDSTKTNVVAPRTIYVERIAPWMNQVYEGCSSGACGYSGGAWTNGFSGGSFMGGGCASGNCGGW